ncbi:hypothetical protein ACFL1J_01760 [Pseudomonadota bacterium]
MFKKEKDFSSVGQESDKMKKEFIAKAIPVVIACSILAIFLVPAGFAYKVGIGGNDADPATSCNSKPGNFTIFPFARLKANLNGSVSGVEVHLSNADGDCSEMIYSSYDVGYNSESGTIRDNNGTAIALR